MEHGVCNSIACADNTFVSISDALKSAYHDASLFRARHENRIRNDLKNIAYQVKYVKTVGVYVYIAYVRVGIKFADENKSIIEFFKIYPIQDTSVVKQEVQNDSSSTAKSTASRNETP